MGRCRDLFVYCAASSLLTTNLAKGFVEPRQKEKDIPIQIKQIILRPTLLTTPSVIKSLNTKNEFKKDTIEQTQGIISGKLHDESISKKLQTSDDFIDYCFAYITKHQDILGFSKDDISLISAATLIGKDEQFIKFKSKKDDLIILDSNIDFRFKYGKLVQIVNQNYLKATFIPKAKIFATDEILAFASKYAAQDGEEAYRVSLNQEKMRYELIRVQKYNIESKDGQKLVGLIRTDTGEIFELKETKHNLNVKVSGEIYQRWYNEQIVEKPFANLEVEVGSDNIFTDDDGTSLELDEFQTPKINGLNGRFVRIHNVSGTEVNEEAIKKDNNWLIKIKNPKTDPWLDKELAQAMVYYHVDILNKKLKKYISTPWLNNKLIANTNLHSTCNAHWDGSTINLYSGDSECANTANISDVIYHEFGHGLDDKTGGIDDDAFSEGYGDIIALTMTGSNLLGIGFFLDRQLPVRDLAPDKIYPRDRGEVHSEGLIIGSTFYDLYQALVEKYQEEKALDMLSNFAYKMIFTARSYLDVYDALLVIDDNDANLSNGTPNKCMINEVFAKHGIATKEEGCMLATIDEAEIKDSDADGVIEPGETLELNFLAKNSRSVELTNLQGTLSVETGKNVEVTNNSLFWNSIAANSSALSKKAATLVIGKNAVCGSEFKTKLKLAGNSVETFYTHTFQIGKNIGKAEIFAGEELPIHIPDNEKISAVLEVNSQSWAEDTQVEKAILSFDISHSYVRDLLIKLKAPNGALFDIYRGSGYDRDVHYKKDITELLKGIVGAGSWELIVEDRANRDEGDLLAASLTMTPHLFSCD